MSHARDCYRNAIAEPFFSNLKRELALHEERAIGAEARAAVFQWITLYYRRTRLRSELGYLRPAPFKQKRREVG